jgi:hypothetical protein
MMEKIANKKLVGIMNSIGIKRSFMELPMMMMKEIEIE